ncbi:Cation diffusion facilitator [Mycena indigotica]|uniref:Cation diffusion facilitator n=1 Tax=Mycena indigotica TaxID=2126181 RepID=A0A8H6SGZ1_9AGAR|nr:Cation diffusion facilitator [Mycena indigotica]KAF7299194.1 Cation diffusion facilitator [Mycena indigotica]
MSTARLPPAIVSGPTTTPITPIPLEDINSPSATATSSDNSSRMSSNDQDPLLLATRLQSEDHINSLRQRKKRRKQGKAAGDFYDKQNKQIASLLMTMDQHIESAQEEEDSNRLAIKIAIRASLIANIVLAILQIYAAASSLSLSFFATAMDAVFDPLANMVLYYCHRLAVRADPRRYPSGGSRLETIGDIVYATSMGSVSVLLIAFSIQDLTRGNAQDLALHIPAVVVVGIAFLVKLALFLYCYSIRSKNSQVRVLWEDHRNDLFINGFGILTSSAGAQLLWWIDPLGALLISLALVLVWGRTIYKQFLLLAGIAAPLEFQQLVIYKAMMFADDIRKIDSCTVYHAGPDYVVELDIVMDADTPLWKAHDLSQALQDKIEQLPNVGRGTLSDTLAYVHVDHEIDHKPEHRKLK